MAQQAYAQPQAVAYTPSAYAPVYGQEQQYVQVPQATYAAMQPGLQSGYAPPVRSNGSPHLLPRVALRAFVSWRSTAVHWSLPVSRNLQSRPV